MFKQNYNFLFVLFRYLVADDLKLFEFQQSIRKKLNLNSTEGLFFFIADKKLENLSKKLIFTSEIIILI